MTIPTPEQPTPTWQLQPIRIAMVDLAGGALIGAKLTLAPDNAVPIEIPGIDGPITVFPTTLGPFTSTAGSVDDKPVGLITTSVPISNDPQVNRELTYTGTLILPSGAKHTATVFVDDITDPGVLWIGPSFVAGTVTPGEVVSPAITYAAFTSLQADVAAIEGGGGTAATTATIVGAGPTGRVLMESETPAIAKIELVLDQVDNTADIDKPVSTLAQLELDDKANTADITPLVMIETGVDTGLFTLADPSGGGDLFAANDLSDLADAATARVNLGLGNVDNTADLAKPISDATQAALDELATWAALLASADVKWLEEVTNKPTINGVSADVSGNYTIPTGTGTGTSAIVTTETSTGSGVYTVSAV